MSNEISWTDKPFYIQSRIDGSNYVLTAADGGTATSKGVKTKPLQANINYLWKAMRDTRGGAFLLHVGTGLYLTRSGDSLALRSINTGDANQLWRVEDLGAPWVGINSWTDWEMKINVYRSDLNGTTALFHWDGGADNEKWTLVEEAGTLDTISVQYHLEAAVRDFNEPPTRMLATFIDNSHGTKDLVSTVSLQRTLTTSRSITTSESDTVGRKYTQTFGAKGGVKDVWEVNASFSFEESSSTTKSLSDQNTDTQSMTDTCTLNVTVPAGKNYRYQVAVYYAKFNIPFTATMRFQSSTAGSAPVTTTIDGIYNGVNAMRSEVEAAEMPVAAQQSAATAAMVQKFNVPITNKVRLAA
jgi:hypothetical protein